jgi:hypothetical protein
VLAVPVGQLAAKRGRGPAAAVCAGVSRRQRGLKVYATGTGLELAGHCAPEPTLLAWAGPRVPLAPRGAGGGWGGVAGSGELAAGRRLRARAGEGGAREGGSAALARARGRAPKLTRCIR